MDIKGYRDYSEHEVLNGLFSFTASSGDKGTFVELVGSGILPDELNGWGPSIDGIANTVSQRYVTTTKVQPAPSGSNRVVGMMLYDVRDVGTFGESLLQNPEERAERQCVLSGQAVPIATRGLFMIKGHSGTATGGSAAYLGPQAGVIQAVSATIAGVNGQRVGTFLGATGRDGYALFKLSIAGM